MGSDEIFCNLCLVKKPLHEYSKIGRRQAEPRCKRCTAWDETQEPDVVPVPLETGHVSIEELEGEFWVGNCQTAADFFPDDLKPQAPITSMAALGLEGDDPVDVDSVLAKAGRLVEVSDTQSNPSASQATNVSILPPHLRNKVGNSSQFSMPSPPMTPRVPSEAGEAAIKSLPPHLRPRYAPSSISTATTVRDDREEKKKSREIEYTAYGPDGTRHQRTRVPTTVDSSVTSEVSRDTTSQTESQPREWPKIPRAPRHSTVPVAIAKRPGSAVDYQRRLGFCDSDNDDDGY